MKRLVYVSSLSCNCMFVVTLDEMADKYECINKKSFMNKLKYTSRYESIDLKYIYLQDIKFSSIRW